MGVWACAKSEENKKACGNLTHFPVGCLVDRSVRNSGVRNSGVRNSGVRNSGVRNSGVRNSGVRNSGITLWFVTLGLLCGS